MSELFLEDVDGRKLAHAYVALAMARKVAQRCLAEQPASDGLRPLITTLDVTAELLEELMEKVLPDDPSPSSSEPILCSEELM